MIDLLDLNTKSRSRWSGYAAISDSRFTHYICPCSQSCPCLIVFIFVFGLAELGYNLLCLKHI